ncbi:MAG: hypothetical protein WC716_04805 [Chitinophagaceae bacterium]
MFSIKYPSFILYIAILLFTSGMLFSCTPKKVSTNNTGDNKVYNDDSEINMKTTEKKAKMPFDTVAAPRFQKIQPELPTE